MRSTIVCCRSLLLSGAAAGLAVSASTASAQVAAGEVAPAEDENVIIVTGSIRESQQAAIETKRVADNFVDVASADSVGRFPDENTAAALARLPGVAVQRDQGQARYIQVRGAPNRWTSVSIDGIPQTGVDESGDGRAYRFDAVPAVLLQQLVINKSLTPDLTAEAITANVDLRTYSPMSIEGFALSGDVGYGFMDLGDGAQRQGSLRVSWSSDTVGVALGGSHYQRDQVTDNREAGYDALGPTDIDIRNYRLERTNNGAFATIEAKPSDALTLYARGIYTEFTDKEQRNAYQIELARALEGTRGLLSGDLIGVPITANYNDGRYENRNYIGSAGFEYDNGDGFGVDGAFGYTRTENTTDLPLLQSTTSAAASPSVTYGRESDPRFPIVQLFETVDDGRGNLSRGERIARLDQTAFPTRSSILLPIVQATTSEAYTVKLDGWREMGALTLKAGVLGSVREIAGNNIGVGGVQSLAAIGFDLNQYVTGQGWHTGFPLGLDLFYIDNPRLNRDLQAALDAAGVDPADFVLPTAFYDQTETIGAGYAMGQFNLDRLLLTAGVRVEYYELENSGTALVGQVQTPLSLTDDTVDIFPSVNARYEVSDNLVVRLSGQRGVSRPAYAAVRVGASINDTAATISGGNPLLRPEYTWGVDGSVEYYFASNGIASVAGFHRWVEDVLYQSQQPIGTDLYNSAGIDRSGYRLTSTFNGGSGTLYGVEFNIEHQFDFLPGALSGLGVQGNLTLLDGDVEAIQPDGSTTTEAFQGLSDTVANASVFYEYAGISARVSYQWRSEYLDTLGGFGAGEFRDGSENLDVTLRYAVNENLTLFADLANLTDEIYVAYEGTRDTPSEVEQIGSRYLFGLRFNY